LTKTKFCSDKLRYTIGFTFSDIKITKAKIGDIVCNSPYYSSRLFLG